MPLLDSFRRLTLIIIPTPAVRVAKLYKHQKESCYSFDLRFCKPNEKMLSEKGIHALEHLFAGFY